MIYTRGFVFLLLAHFMEVAIGLESCSTLKPGRVFSMNSSILECFYPLDYYFGKSCEAPPGSYPRCVDNSECVQRPDSVGTEEGTSCLCKKNFKMTGIFTCEPAMGRAQECQSYTILRDEFRIDDCDIGLRCTNGRCECEFPADDGLCLLQPGSRCYLESINQTTRCGPNSVCVGIPGSQLGDCTCVAGYESKMGSCIKVFGLGEHCDGDGSDNCDATMGLRCSSGTCVCDFQTDEIPNACRIRLWRRCSANGARCIKDGECISGECKCKKGFVEADSGRKCVPLKFLGESCEGDSKCDDTSGLTCTNGRCKCRNEMSLDKGFCILAAESGCSVSNARARCDVNSTCKTWDDYGSDSGRCRCDPGFVGSYNDMKCHLLLSKGGSCTPGNFRNNHFCNEQAGLDCDGTSKVCSCPNGESVDGKCKIKIGQSCNSPVDPSLPSCPVNSACIGSGDYRRCQCLSNFLATPDKSSCAPQRSHMGICGESIGECTEGLVCTSGRCQCRNPSEQVFDPEVGKCQSKGRCESDSECPSRSSCQPLYEGSYTKWCKCKDGYTADSRSLCKGNYLTSCSSPDGCQTANSMDCIDGVCRCSAVLNQIYDPVQSACVGLVGSPCGTNNHKCISSSICGTTGLCTCPRDTLELRTGKCAKLLEVGSNCTSNPREDTGLVETCHWNKGLACVKGVCACVDPNLEYVPNQGTCVAKLGSICDVQIPVGNCDNKQDGNGYFNFKPCNHYNIICARMTTCREDRNGISRCLPPY